MMLSHLGSFFLSWFYWDPPRDAFSLPYFHHPIAWYGIFFAFGVLCAYVVVRKILFQRVLSNADIVMEDVREWKEIVRILQAGSHGKTLEPIGQIYHRCSPKMKEQIKAYCGDREPSPHLKEGLLKVLSNAIRDQTFCESVSSNRRGFVTGLFPKAFVEAKEISASLTDKLTVYMIIGVIVGARLGDALFYGLPHFLEHPMDIFKVWEGGLASHGAAIGALIAIALFRRKVKKRFPFLNALAVLDTIVIPTAFAGGCIRIGNFFNQEILGTETNLPWGVIFGHPWYGESIVPRHPAQLYEAICYFLIFVVLYGLWKSKGTKVVDGFYSGLFFLLIFSTRFIAEWLKEPQAIDASTSFFLSTGQILSLPFIFAGLYLVMRKKRQPPTAVACMTS